MAGIFDGLTVIELAGAEAAALLGMMLADNGARVVLVEPPGGSPLRSQPGALVWHRGKEGLTLDLAAPAGRAVLHALARRADIVLESFGPGIAERLAADYAALSRENPRLVQCSITPWGSDDAPYRDLPGHPHLVAARTGVFDQPGFRPGPNFLVAPVPSLGAMLLALQGVAAALYQREITGRGQLVETSLYAGALAYQGGLIAAEKQTAAPAAGAAVGRTPFGASPFYRLYPCADGRWLQFGCINLGFVQKAVAAMGLEEVMATGKYGDGRNTIPSPQAREELIAIIGAKLKEKPLAEWAAIFTAADVPFAEPETTEQYMNDPQVRYSGLVVTVDDPTVGPMEQMGLPLLFHATPGQVRGPAPLPGQHTAAILRELGYADGEMPQVQAGGMMEDRDSRPSPSRSS